MEGMKAGGKKLPGSPPLGLLAKGVAQPVQWRRSNYRVNYHLRLE